MNEFTVLQLADDVTFQSLGDNLETAILSLETGTLYSCNRTTESFLKALDGQRTFAEAVDLLLEEFAVTRQVMVDDLLEIAEILVAEKLIVVAGHD